jgi:RNA polymerase sigma-70 factor (ECF subfamily)
MNNRHAKQFIALPVGPAPGATSLDFDSIAAGSSEDHALVAATHAGDRAAFAALIGRHQLAVYAYLRARLFEPADAEDLCQEVFLRCYTAAANFDGPELVRPWLIGIARNLLRERVRRLKRRREVAWTEICIEVEGQSVAVDQRRDDAIRMLPDCLDSLGPTAREALEMHYRSNLRLAAIGERMHRSEGAIKLLMFRARQALRLCLNGRLRAEQHD